MAKKFESLMRIKMIVNEIFFKIIDFFEFFPYAKKIAGFY